MLPYQPPPPMTCQQIRDVDAYAINTLGIPGIVLMENAALGITDWLLTNTSPAERARVVLLAGPGNNGGDALAVLRLLAAGGTSATAVLAAEPDRYRGDAGTNLAIVRRMGLPCLDPEADDDLPRAGALLAEATLIVDGLLGTGARGAPRGRIGRLIERACAAGARRIAIDLPSGLDGDSGGVSGRCFRADVTLTLLAEKVGFAGASRGLLGQVVVLGIGIPPDVVSRVQK